MQEVGLLVVKMITSLTMQEVVLLSLFYLSLFSRFLMFCSLMLSPSS